MTSETDAGPARETPTVEKGHPLQLNIRPKPVSGSDRPLFSNFMAVQNAPGPLFEDFGLLVPGALPAVARLLQSGEKLPDTTGGRLACRTAKHKASDSSMQHFRRTAGPAPGAREVRERLVVCIVVAACTPRPNRPRPKPRALAPNGI